MDISKHPLLTQCYELNLAIEVCGVSPALTKAVTKASEVMQGVEQMCEENERLRSDIARLQALRRPNPAHGAPKPTGHNPVA